MSLDRPITAMVVLATLSFAKDVRAEPTKQECVEANEKAQDLRQAGKLHAARDQLARCIATACPGPVREDCAQRLAEVDAAQPKVVFSAKDASGNDLEAVRVTVDGAAFADKLDGTAFDVDPGEHTFRFEGADGAVIEKRLVVREGEKRRSESVVLHLHMPAVGVAGAPMESASSSWGAYAAFGAGGVGLVVGTVFGVLALGTKSTLDSACGGPRTGCPPGQVNALNMQAWGADIGLGVAVVGAAVGTVLLVSQPSPAKRQGGVFPWVGVLSAGIGGTYP
jgi:hypothetical protein